MTQYERIAQFEMVLRLRDRRRRRVFGASIVSILLTIAAVAALSV